MVLEKELQKAAGWAEVLDRRIQEANKYMCMYKYLVGTLLSQICFASQPLLEWHLVTMRRADRNRKLKWVKRYHDCARMEEYLVAKSMSEDILNDDRATGDGEIENTPQSSS